MYSVCRGCGETNKKHATMAPADEGGLVMPGEGNSVIGSSFTGAGIHILLDTSPRVAELTKATLTVIYRACPVVSLQNNAAEQQNISKEVRV